MLFQFMQIKLRLCWMSLDSQDHDDGRHSLCHSSNLQSTVSLLWGESEYYALVKTAALGMATQELLKSWGINTKFRVYTDSSAALGTCNRLGLGKSRHIQTRLLLISREASRKSFGTVQDRHKAEYRCHMYESAGQ